MLGVIRVAAGVMLLGLGAFFALAFHERYWRWRDCFNELGRCYDPDSQLVYLEQAGVAWGTLTVLCVALGLFLLLVRRRRP